jgi:hypothetical protein
MSGIVLFSPLWSIAVTPQQWTGSKGYENSRRDHDEKGSRPGEQRNDPKSDQSPHPTQRTFVTRVHRSRFSKFKGFNASKFEGFKVQKNTGLRAFMYNFESLLYPYIFS